MSSSQIASAPVFDRFQAVIGVDDGVLGRQGTVRFIAQLDGKEVLHTEVMRPGDAARPVDIPLNGAHSLRLIVDDAGDGHGGDWGDWADARLVSSRTGEVLFLSDLDAVVEQEWIPTRLDRNLVQDPILLNGILYQRGLGTDSGSSMVYDDWDRLWRARQEKEAVAEEDAAARWGPLVLRGAPGTETQIVLNGVDITADLRAGRAIVYPARAVLQVHAGRPPAGASLVGLQALGVL
ncbi:MAG TPA: NPCBM/NEW2 domain-containing protein, partial [Chthonomonadaceae bacterium]|nr:NPCBM/NEW2 domain-containing protein [Chthonomonadaceae bacterium]